MNKIMKSILGVLNGVSRAFLRYPASMICAIVVAISFNITIATENDFNNNLLFALELVFFFGAIFNMAISALAQKSNVNSIINGVLNVLGLIVTTAIFLIVYLPSLDVSNLSTQRIIIATFISLISFLIIASAKAEKFDYNQMIFMSIKSFFVALIYALVIMLGLFFIAFAVKSLLYNELNSNVYTYIAIYSALAGFSFFLGYFPSFKKDEEDEQIEKAIKYPRFIEVLFLYILIPLITILSIVLLLWVIQILIKGKLPEFVQLTGIFSGYSLIGLFIYTIVSPYKTGIAKIYRKVFPFPTLLFLAFEAYAILNQISINGVKIAEYAISLYWIFFVLATTLIIFIPVAKNRLLGYLAIIILAISVSPIVGVVDFPVRMQVMRLENVLIKNKMLENGKIIPISNLNKEDKIVITDSSLFIVEQKDSKPPIWFNKSINDPPVFNTVYGFEQTFKDIIPDVNLNKTIHMILKDDYYEISGYNYFINYNPYGSQEPINITGKKGNYSIKYDLIGQIIVKKDGIEIINASLKSYFDGLFDKYNDGTTSIKSGPTGSYPVKEMSFKVEKNGVRILIIFDGIDVFHTLDGTNYMQTLKGIYLAE